MLSWLKANLTYLVLFVGLVVVDQTTKHLAFNSDFGSFLNALHPIFGKQLFLNDRFAFSLPVPTVLGYLIYLVLLGGLLLWFVRLDLKSNNVKLAFILILAGALANILERMTLGHVRDFIYIGWGNIFNLADAFIVVGILLMLKEK